MQTLLPIKISLFSDNSQSPRLADRFVLPVDQRTRAYAWSCATSSAVRWHT